MAEIAKFIQLIQQTTNRKYLSVTLQSDSLKLALENLYSILNQSLKHVGDGKLGLQSWNPLQIQALVSIAKSFSFATRSFPSDQTEPTVVAIIDQSLEFAIRVLEKSVFSSDDLSLQNDALQFLEGALVDGTDKECDASQPCSLDTLVELLPVVPAKTAIVKLDNHIKFNLRGLNCLSEDKPVEQILMSLASDFLQQDSQATISTELFYCQYLNNMI